MGRWITLAVLFAVFAALLTASVVRAQDNGTIMYAEGGTDPVATLSATDPEGATPIAWFIAPANADPDGTDGPLATTDAVDAEDFDIDEKTGALTFDVGGDADSPDNSVSPDFENPSGGGATSNTYMVVAGACDVALVGGACPATGRAGYHKVTVMVTDVDEPGKITLATDTANGTPQYLVGAELTATASDGDITGTQTFSDSSVTGVSGVTWRWYRGETEITGADAQDNTYTLLAADAGQHIRAVVYYIVAGNVDQEMAEKATDYPVLAARVGANQLKFDPAAVSRTISEGDKGRNVGAPVTATGNHGTVRYALTGTDSDQFEIDEKTGQITTSEDLNYEADTTNTTNQCNTANSCGVTVTATDSTGDSTSTASTNLNATVTITITDVDEMPDFSTGSQTVGVPENSTDLYGSADGYSASAVADVTYTAMDPEERTVSYSLMGPDASKFQLSGSDPVLSFVSGPDFEAKASADGDNVYEVTVRASVGGDTGERMVRVTVGNVDEGPDVSGPSSRNFAENGEDAVATFMATDPEGATPIAWDIVEGAGDPDGAGDLTVADNADAASFTIDEDGMLKFSIPPDFENPADSNATDNTYKVVVVACDVALVSNACPDTGEAGYHKVTVMVTNMNEPGKVTLATSTPDGTPQYLVGAILTATASDGDITNADQDFIVDEAGEVTGVTWRWYRGGTVITGADAQDNTYTLLQADANHRIRVLVTYRVGSNTNQESASLTTDYPVLAARVGANQLEFDPAAVSRTISEGDKGRNVGAPVTATGNHGTVRYSLDTGGDAALFEIDDKTGQITTNVVLDYESGSVASATDAGSCSDATNNSPDRECTVTVTATDSTGDDPTNNATVTIMLTDVGEMPSFSTGAQTVDVPENSTALWDASDTTNYNQNAVTDVTYTAMDPEGRTVNYSLMGPDASKFRTTGNPPVLSFLWGPDFEAKASADGDNVYEVTVRASVGGDTGERMVRVTVGNVDEGPMISAGPAIRGDSSVDYEENGLDDVAMYEVTGLADGATVSWTLSGDDEGDFDISSGVLTFASPPDYEGPADANTDNVYEVTVMAGDGTDTAILEVEVTVTDQESEAPVDPVDIYDRDNDGDISRSELFDAVEDYFNEDLERSDLFDIIEAYFAS